MSELSVGSLSGLAANSYVIDVASGSSLDLSNGATLPAGSIVGFESVLKTDTWSASVASGGNAAITDLSITYSLSNASNKLMITAFCGVVSSSAGFGNMGLGVAADGTLINVGDAASPRTSVQAGGYSHSTVSSGDIIASLNAVTVYAPGTTSAVTYTVRAINNDGSTRTLYANRSASDTGVTAYPRAVSSFIIQEVAA